MSAPITSHVSFEHAVNWPEDLEELHEESSRTHFIDVWTRRAMLARLGPLSAAPTVIDVGCSTGYLLEDLRRAIPAVRLIGVDLVAGGLRKAQRNCQTLCCCRPTSARCHSRMRAWTRP